MRGRAAHVQLQANQRESQHRGRYLAFFAMGRVMAFDGFGSELYVRQFGGLVGFDRVRRTSSLLDLLLRPLLRR